MSTKKRCPQAHRTGTVAPVRRLTVLLTLVTLIAAGCGDDGDSERETIAELLVAEGETPEAAACFAEELDEFSLEEFEAFLAAESSGEADEALFAAAAAAAEICAEPAP